MIMGSKMESYKSFYDEVGKNYPEEDIVYRSLGGRLRRAFILTYLTSCKGTLLDVGCNQGMYLREYTGGMKVGMDISLSVLQRIRGRGEETPLVIGDAQSLNCFRTEVFDTMICSEVLEHVAYPRKVLRGMIRLLKPGGQVLVTVPNYRRKRPEWVDIGTMKGYGVHGIKADTYFHTAFRTDELAEMGESAGFDIIETGTLEKGVKYAAKIPFLFFRVLRFLNGMTFQNTGWDRYNQKMYDVSTVWIYTVVRGLGLHRFLLKWIFEGVRSYAILGKPKV